MLLNAVALTKKTFLNTSSVKIGTRSTTHLDWMPSLLTLIHMPTEKYCILSTRSPGGKAVVSGASVISKCTEFQNKHDLRIIFAGK